MSRVAIAPATPDTDTIGPKGENREGKRGEQGGQKGRVGRVKGESWASKRGEQGGLKRSFAGEMFPPIFSPMNQITVPSALIAPIADRRLTPAMTSVLWEISAVLDERRTPASVADAVWLNIPTKRLRGGGGGRSDNHWLSECLDRLTGVKISGEYKGDPWGAVILAEWHLIEGGSIAKLLIPPTAVAALRSPETFAKIETEAAHRLRGPARRLYAILADKKRLGRPSWTFSLDELRVLLAVNDRPSYDRWQAFKRWVLAPALEAINEFGTVEVSMTPVKEGRSVRSVRFQWRWKTADEAREVSEENTRHSKARRQRQESEDAPPMIEAEPQADKVQDWWVSLTDAERDKWSDLGGRTFEAGGTTYTRNERDLAIVAYEAAVSAGEAP